MSTLFKPQTADPAKRTIRRGFSLRDFQDEDVGAVESAWASGHRGVLCVWSTGLGKSVGLAELAARRPAGSQCYVIVDSSALAKDLYGTIHRHTGNIPGILTGAMKSDWKHNGVVVTTKQCLCARNGGDPYYQWIDWSKVSRLLVDECEAALADGYAAMMMHAIDANPSLKIAGMTATPLPSGNRKITDLFEYAAEEPGPLYRDLQWSYLNGWLVKPKQAVVKTSMDFSSVKVRKNDLGEKDYSEKDLARLMMDQDEREWLELGSAIYQVTKGHTAIVVCPNSTDVADKLSGYIEGAAREDDQQDYAYSIHRSLGHKEADDLMDRFKAGDFPCAVSVRMFEKGFDYDRVDMVVMVRRTKSLRLYAQAAGRGTRPLVEVRQQLQKAESAEERMRIIAESEKPHCVIVDCVGVDDSAKDILGVIDILGRGVSEDIRERVRRNMIDKANADAKDSNTPNPPDEEEPEEGDDVGDAAREAKRQINEERERRSYLAGKADVHYEEMDGRKSAGHQHKLSQKPVRGSSSAKQAALLMALGAHPHTALATSKRQAGAMIDKMKKAGKEPNWRLVRQYERQNGRIE